MHQYYIRRFFDDLFGSYTLIDVLSLNSITFILQFSRL